MTGYMAEYLAGLILLGIALPSFFNSSLTPPGTKMQILFAILLIVLAFFHVALVS